MAAVEAYEAFKEACSAQEIDFQDILEGVYERVREDEAETTALARLAASDADGARHTIRMFRNANSEDSSVFDLHVACVIGRVFCVEDSFATALINNGVASHMAGCFAKLYAAMISGEDEADNALCSCVWLLHTLIMDTVNNFRRGKALIENAALMRSLGQLVTHTTRPGSSAIPVYVEPLIWTIVNMIRSCHRKLDSIHALMAELHFPRAFIAQYQQYGDPELAMYLFPAYNAGPEVARELDESTLTRTIVSMVLGEYGGVDGIHVDLPGVFSCIWNGSDSREGSMALLPHVPRLRDYLVTHLDEDGLQVLRDHTIDELFISYMQRTDLPHGASMQVLCCVVNLVGKVENHPTLKTDQHMIDRIFTDLDCALKGQDSPDGGKAAPWEPMMALARLSLNDNNKAMLAATCLDTVLRVLADPFAEERLEQYATEVLCNVAFTVDFGSKTAAATSVLERLAADGHTDETKRMAAFGLFQMKQSTTSAAEQKNTLARQKSKAGHIMISYPWKHQEFMLRVRTWLQDAGHEVWMDVDFMKGNILEAMSSAVENASVVVLCLCPEYKDSNACRTEGQYAHKLGKPIIPIRPVDYDATGWLGLIMANALYYDFSHDPEDFDRREAFLNAVAGEVSDSMSTVPAISDRGSTTAATPLDLNTSVMSNGSRQGGVSSIDLLKKVLDQQQVLLEKIEQLEDTVRRQQQGCCSIS